MTTLDILEVRTAALPTPLTLSGNEITPATRAAGTQGDGLTGVYRDSSIGAWEATTNLNVNGNGGTNTTGVTDSGATNTRVTTGVVKFGSTAFQAVTANAAANEGAYEAISGGAASTQYTASVWVWAPTGSPTVRVAIYDDVSGKQASSAVTLTTVPQRITVTATTGGGSTVFRTYVETDVQQNVTFRWGGLQTEAQPLATPYVHTDGGTASRSAARIQLPNITRYVTASQGWLAMLLRAGFAFNTTKNPAFFVWGDDNDNSIRCDYLASGDFFEVRRAASASVGSKGSVASSHAVGDLVFVVCQWSPTTLDAAINGAAFSGTQADTNIPSLTTTTADVGSAGTIFSTRQIDSEILFVAMGKSLLPTSGPAILNNIARNNRIESRPEDLPGGCTFKWPNPDNWREGMAL